MVANLKNLLAALKSKDWRTRLEAAVALGKIGDAKAVGPLIKCLKHKDVTVGDCAATRHAVEALGRIGDRRAVDPLIQALKHEDFDVRAEAVVALQNIGDTQAIKALERTSEEDEDSEVQQIAKTALENFERGRRVR